MTQLTLVEGSGVLLYQFGPGHRPQLGHTEVRQLACPARVHHAVGRLQVAVVTHVILVKKVQALWSERLKRSVSSMELLKTKKNKNEQQTKKGIYQLNIFNNQVA